MLSIEPRGKQVTALNMLRAAWKESQSFLLYAPVGFGKTAIAGFITDGFISRDMRVLFVAPYSRITYGCTGATYDETGCHYAEGRSLADDHYAESRETVVDVSDPEVLALVMALEKAQRANNSAPAITEVDRKEGANQINNQNYYIYHFSGAIEGKNATYSGIAQLTFRIVCQQDLERFKEVASQPGNKIGAILSLSYLGREIE